MVDSVPRWLLSPTIWPIQSDHLLIADYDDTALGLGTFTCTFLKSRSMTVENLFILFYFLFLGRQLWVVKISTENQRSDLKPMVKYVANMHGNEVVGRELLLGSKICIKYRKHGSFSFSHTFNCVCQHLYLGYPKSCQMAAHNLMIYISIFYS